MLFHRNQEGDSEIMWKNKGIGIAKAIFFKKKHRGHLLPNFDTYYKTTAIKTVIFVKV